MGASPLKTLIEPGHAEDWARLAAEKRRLLTPSPDVELLVAGLSSIVGFKRLADRPQDRNDLIALADIHGELPIEPIPGLDT